MLTQNFPLPEGYDYTSLHDLIIIRLIMPVQFYIILYYAGVNILEICWLGKALVTCLGVVQLLAASGAWSCQTNAGAARPA